MYTNLEDICQDIVVNVCLFRKIKHDTPKLTFNKKEKKDISMTQKQQQHQQQQNHTTKQSKGTAFLLLFLIISKSQ